LSLRPSCVQWTTRGPRTRTRAARVFAGIGLFCRPLMSVEWGTNFGTASPSLARGRDGCSRGCAAVREVELAEVGCHGMLAALIQIKPGAPAPAARCGHGSRQSILDYLHFFHVPGGGSTPVCVVRGLTVRARERARPCVCAHSPQSSALRLRERKADPSPEVEQTQIRSVAGP